jgi:raffinose/stachyose/melibiose transport system substrate-binding protein
VQHPSAGRIQVPGRNGMSRRSFLRRGAAIASVPTFGGLLQACGGGDGGGEGGAASLDFWWWAEQDAPGANKFLDESIAAWRDQGGERAAIKIAEQQTDTLVANFQSAAAARSGPDIASQWATGPVLSQAWGEAISPISQHVDAAEIEHWLFRQENMYDGELWAAPLYIIGQPFTMNKKLFEQADLDPEDPPADWDALIAACEQLKKAGITPLGLGNQDTFGGRWMFAFLAVQQLNELDELRQMVIGEASFTDPKFTEWMDRLKELIDRKYFNDDVMSLDFGSGFDVFGSGKAAMSWATEGAVRDWSEKLGEDAVAPIPMPKFGSGQLADAYTATQSTAFFPTAWASDPAEAAAFLAFLHTEERLNSWYEHTNIIPADDRFDREQARSQSDLSRQLVDLSSSGPQIWLENWIPPELDDKANGPAGQVLFTGGTVKEAAAIWDQQAEVWRSQQRDDLERWKAWDQSPVVV